MKKNSPAVLQAFIDIFFPRQCFGCETPLKFYEINLCLDCQIRMSLTSFHKTKKNLLFQKLELHFPIENATALFHFEKVRSSSAFDSFIQVPGNTKNRLVFGRMVSRKSDRKRFLSKLKRHSSRTTSSSKKEKKRI